MIQSTSPSEAGYRLWNIYLGMKSVVDRGYSFNHTKTYVSRKTYSNHKRLGFIEYLATNISEVEPYLLSCFINSRKFDIFELIDRMQFYDNCNNKRLNNLTRLSTIIPHDISRLKDISSDIQSMLVSFGKDDFPEIYSTRFTSGVSWETIVYLHDMTNFLNQDAIKQSEDEDFINWCRRAKLYQQFIKIDQAILTTITQAI